MATIEVQSDRDPEIVYQVDVEAGTCECPHFTKKLRLQNERDGTSLICKHVRREREKVAQEQPA